MKIAILGAGVMESFGTALIKKGHEVVFFDMRNHLLDQMKTNPYAHVKKEDGSVEDIKVTVLQFEEAPNYHFGFMIMTVKSSMTEEVMRTVLSKGMIGENTLVMTFQCGFGNPEVIDKYLKVKTNCLPAYTCSYCKSIEDYMIQKTAIWSFRTGKKVVPYPSIGQIAAT